MKRKALLLTAALTIFSSVGVLAATGTDRTWSASLPHDNGNVYFAIRDKETRETQGYVKATELDGTPGVNAWFNTGSHSRPIKITDIAGVTTENVVYNVRYRSNSAVGTEVFLGIEDKEDTCIINNDAAGTVNYK
ncbi:hypothetical protein [Haloimpatiens massiliensis]|uniref:hypothetical protein n=1 Tax=Haloimpatiens massiliensis TaxID=1658110 RepID=UPI000C827D67|nr:hypothetical protein [Haloimpatiens massiliensis]